MAIAKSSGTRLKRAANTTGPWTAQKPSQDGTAKDLTGSLLENPLNYVTPSGAEMSKLIASRSGKYTIRSARIVRPTCGPMGAKPPPCLWRMTIVEASATALLNKPA